MHDYYAARASEYDRIYQKPERQPDLAALKKWLPGQFADARLLEVACGTGYWTQFIAPVAAEIVAVDTSVETMDIARSRVPANKVKFIVGDAYRLPTDQGMFNAGFAGFWFSHVPRTRQREFLVGLGARLRPGAKVILIDNLYVIGSSQPIFETDAEGNTYQMRVLDDGSTHRVLKNFTTESDLLLLLAGLGKEARFTRFGHFWAFQYVVTGELGQMAEVQAK